MSPKRLLQVWRLHSIVASLEAAAALAVLAAIPREGAGFSVARIGILAFLLGMFLLGAVFALRPPPRLARLASPPAILAVGLLALSVGVSIFLLRYLEPNSLLPVYQRLSVPLWYALVVSLQTCAILTAQRFGIHAGAIAAQQGLWRRAGIAWSLLLAAFALVALTGWGITPDSAYWGEPGVPILGWQLALAMVAGVGVLFISRRWGHWAKLDTAIAVAIWLLAVAIWLSVPLDVLRNSFYAPIRPPSGQPFPNSDAGYYDSMAHSLLIGYPYQGEIPSRPLYIVGLTALHALVGEKYELIIAGQTLVLAMIPVLLYWLGRAIHSRPAGAIAALAAIGREWTSLLVSSATRVSNTKMLLVDLPTLMAMLACCYLGVRWLAGPTARRATIAGGMFGVLLLLRTQAVLTLPGIITLGVLAIGLRNNRNAARQLGLFLLAAFCAILPWLVHNYLLSGQVSLDAPFQFRIIASQYRYTGNLDIGNVDLEGRSLLAVLAMFAARDPGFVLAFIANHAFATQVGGVLALPLFHSYNGLLADINLYWVNWTGSLSAQNILLVAAYLAVIALGLAAAWKRLRWTGLLPLAVSGGYSLANGVARFSGWRYDLPADWIAYFYFSIGVAELLLVLVGVFGARRTLMQSALPIGASHKSELNALLPGLTLFLLVGATPWLAEWAAPPRYGAESIVAVDQELSSEPAVAALGVRPAEIQRALTAPDSTVEIGRVLYPRFFIRGTGLASAHPWPAYAPRDFARLGFLLLNSARHDVLLPVRQAPLELRHGADAIVLGCQRTDYLEARLILLPGSGVAIQGTPLSEPCP